MIRARGRYQNQTLQLDEPLGLADGTEVEIDIHVAEAGPGADDQEWAEAGMGRLEQEWNNPDDAIYDDWKKLYGV